ncbi:MAG: DUF6230 family protein [Nocardioidaceae bacterium]
MFAVPRKEIHYMSAETATVGRVRWKRFAAILAPAVVASAVLLALTAEGALATSFSVSGKPFYGTASSVAGTGFVNYSETLPDNNGVQRPVAVNVIRKATAIKNFCLAIPMGPITTLMKAGGKGTPVSGSNVAFVVQKFTGSAVMHGLVMGQDASTLDQAPGWSGSPGSFGMQATGAIKMSGAAMQAREMAAGTISMPGFSIAVTHGGSC